MYEIHHLLYDVRRSRDVAERFHAESETVLDAYGVEGALRQAVAALDVRTLFDAGVNPYLLYFAALQLGVPRDAYYAALNGKGVASNG